MKVIIKTFLLSVLATILLSPRVINAQNNTAVDSILYRTKMNDTLDRALEAKLIELSLKGPAYQSADQQIKMNELQLKTAKDSWLNLLSVSMNYNDQTFASSATTTSYVYPKYFFGLTIPLGVIFSHGTQVKSARAAVAYTKLQQEILGRNIKALVLGQYRAFKNYNILIEIQSELINDVIANAADTEDGFKNGTKTVDDYIRTQKSKNDELAKLMNLRLEQYKLKLEIEKIIGMNLEEVALLLTNPATATGK